MEQGIIKNGKDSGALNNASADKPKFWSRNKNVTNDGAVDARVVNRAQPTLSLQGPNQNVNQSQANNTTTATTNAVQSNVVRPQRNMAPKINCTPLGEPIDATLKKSIQTNMITFP